MHTFHVDTSLDWNIHMTERVSETMRLFGLRLKRLQQQQLRHRCTIELEPGQICYIGGASGSGKSVLLNALYEQAPNDQRIRLSEIDRKSRQSVIDSIDAPVRQAAAILSKAGLSDVFSMLRYPSQLSAGQQWRYCLARALAMNKQWIFADEFTATLDRISASVIACNLRKIATETNKIFIVASCHEDMLVELQPDLMVMKCLNGKTTLIEKNGQTRMLSSPH